MTAVEKHLEQQAKSTSAVKTKPEPPPHIVANFKGTFYRGGKSGMETEPFSSEIKIPLSWVERDDLTPVAIFIKFYAARVLSEKTGFSGVRTIELVSTSELPKALTAEQQINWTADYSGLAALAKVYGKNKFPVLDAEGKISGQETVEVNCDLYPEVSALRAAITRCMSEPQAFKREQARLAGSAVIVHRRMEDELAALGYS